jgi:hypothetical protein
VSLHFNSLLKGVSPLHISRFKSVTIQTLLIKISCLINSIREKGAVKFHLFQRWILHNYFMTISICFIHSLPKVKSARRAV